MPAPINFSFIWIERKKRKKKKEKKKKERKKAKKKKKTWGSSVSSLHESWSKTRDDINPISFGSFDNLFEDA